MTTTLANPRFMSFRPVISCGGALLPDPDQPGALRSFPLHRGLTFRALAFHPDEPWRAIFHLTLGPTESSHAVTTFAVTASAERLRAIAAQLLEAADHLDIKPATKEPRK